MDKVWIFEEDIPGELLHLGAFVSLIRYTRIGTDFEVWMDNDEFEITEEDD